MRTQVIHNFTKFFFLLRQLPEVTEETRYDIVRSCTRGAKKGETDDIKLVDRWEYRAICEEVMSRINKETEEADIRKKRLTPNELRRMLFAAIYQYLDAINKYRKTGRKLQNSTEYAKHMILRAAGPQFKHINAIPEKRLHELIGKFNSSKKNFIREEEVCRDLEMTDDDILRAAGVEVEYKITGNCGDC